MLQNASCASEWRKYLDIACCFSDFSDVCFAHIVSCFRRKARHFWSWHLLLSAVKSTERSLHGVLSAAIICPREFQYVRHCHGSGGLLPRKPGLDPRLVNVRFAVDKSSAGIFFFSSTFVVFLSVSLQQCLILSFNYTLILPEGRADGLTKVGNLPRRNAFWK